MIDVNTIPLNDDEIEELRHWAGEYRTSFSTPMPWKRFARETDIGESTLQAFIKGCYTGVKINVARKLFAYRQAVDAQPVRESKLPEDPGIFEHRDHAPKRAACASDDSAGAQGSRNARALDANGAGLSNGG